MTNFLELARSRYSSRAYRSDAVPREALERVLEAANLAPTAANRQPFRLLVRHTAGCEEELLRVYNKPWFVQAPLVVGIVGVPREAWRRRSDGKSYLDVDAAIAFDHLTLQAASEGLGTCWVAAFDPEAAREVFAIPSDMEPIAFSPLGYPADRPKAAKRRRGLDELVVWERFS